jgi:large conductance mechanosensitive channel
VWSYGLFINQVVQFVIMAFAVFMLVRAINRLRATIEEPEVKGEPVTKQCPFCLSDIPYKAQKCAHCTSELPTMVAQTTG